MSKLNRALHEIQTIDLMAKEDQWVNRIHPLVKLILTFVYIATVVSFEKYDLTGLIGMSVYPLAIFILGDLSFREALWRMRVVLPLVCAVGIFNPFFDHSIVAEMGGIAVWGGVVSMLTLMLKGVLAVLASYLLIATTTIEKLCYAMRLLHLPKGFVTQILLIYRYITVLLKEAERITQAYSLRAPNQKGVHFKAWGSLAGQLLLRSIDRADDVYESMCLRGYRGEFYPGKKICCRGTDVVYLVVWIVIFLMFRLTPVLQLFGGMLL